MSIDFKEKICYNIEKNIKREEWLIAQLKDLIVNGPSRFIGSVQASADPTEDMELATKQYVDNMALTAGTGDVIGPSSSTDGHIVAFDGTTGKIIKDIESVPIANGGTGATTAAAARTNLGLGDARIFYGTCATRASTVAKVVSCSTYDGNLTNGDTIIVKFSSTNTGAVANLTLAINNGTTTTTAKSIKKSFANTNAQNLSSTAEINAGAIQMFTYNGTYWILMNSDYNTNTNTLQTTYRSSTNIDLPLTAYNAANSATATKVGYDSGTSKAVYAAIPATVANQATYNPSTGKIIVPGSIDTNILTANELKGYVTAGQLSGSTLGTNATAEGYNTTASGNYSHAEGYQTIASGVVSHAEGTSTTASGIVSHAEGSEVIASGDYSHAEGGQSVAEGDYSHAEGNNTNANGFSSHAEGNGTGASGSASHAEGYGNFFISGSTYNQMYSSTITCRDSTNFNTFTIPTEVANTLQLSITDYYIKIPGSSDYYKILSYSSAETLYPDQSYVNIESSGVTRLHQYFVDHQPIMVLTIRIYVKGNFDGALGDYSHTEGLSTIAIGKSQHVFGEYNIQDICTSANNRGSFIEIVGNGTSNTIRSNARTLDWDGNEELAGNLLPMGETQSLGSMSKNWNTIWVNHIVQSNNDDQNLNCPGIDLYNSSIAMNFGQDTYNLVFQEGIISNINVNSDTVETLLRLQPDIDSGSSSGTSGDGKTGVKILGSKGLIFTNNDTYGITSGSACQKFESTDSDLDNEYITIYGNNNLKSSLQINSAQIIARRKNYGFKCQTNAVEIELKIGSGNENRGIWDATGNRWMIHSEGTTSASTKVYVGNSNTANDYAEPRNALKELEPGRCVVETGYEDLIYSTERLQRGCQIVSDTYGFLIGGKFTEDEETEYIETPIAVAGRVLAYPYESIEEFKNHIGWPVCSGPNGTVSIMTEEEEIKYPSRIVGTISQIPEVKTYKQNGKETIKVNGRVWIKVK